MEEEPLVAASLETEGLAHRIRLRERGVLHEGDLPGEILQAR